jgi:hypothetical protein
LLLNSAEHAALVTALEKESWTLEPLEAERGAQNGWVNGRDFFSAEPSVRKMSAQIKSTAPPATRELPPPPLVSIPFNF